MRKWKALCAVRERHRAFSWGVESSEDVDEHCDETEMGWTALRNEEAKSGSEQRPSHLRKSEKKQAAATECVDGPNSGPGESKVDKTKAKGSDECFSLRGAGLSKDSARVERNDVDCVQSVLDPQD